MKRAETASLAVTVAGFAIVDRDRVTAIALDEIAGITAYQLDLITVDLLCWDIALGPGDGTKVITLHEDLPGFDAVVDACSRLPDFKAGWRTAVLATAFVENRTEVYCRP